MKTLFSLSLALILAFLVGTTSNHRSIKKLKVSVTLYEVFDETNEGDESVKQIEHPDSFTVSQNDFHKDSRKLLTVFSDANKINLNPSLNLLYLAQAPPFLS